METEDLSKLFIQRYSAWQKDQVGQTSGYDYEKTFVEMMREFSQIAFQQSFGELPASRNEKKTSVHPSEK